MLKRSVAFLFLQTQKLVHHHLIYIPLTKKKWQSQLGVERRASSIPTVHHVVQAAKETSLIPAGMKILPEAERLEMLETLQKSSRDVERQLATLPFRIETPSQVRYAHLQQLLGSLTTSCLPIRVASQMQPLLPALGDCRCLLGVCFKLQLTPCPESRRPQAVACRYAIKVV